MSGVADEVNLLWDWRTNQGFPFLSNPEDVPVLRALLAGERLQDQAGFEWLGAALREAEEDE